MIRRPGLAPGDAFPLGATFDGDGTNVSVFASAATRVAVCLFDGTGGEERVALVGRTGPWWHASLPGVGPGQRYGLRAWGSHDPVTGHRHNPAKLLIDPYARALDGALVWNDALVDGNDVDSAPFVPKGVVVDGRFDWGDDRHPRTPWHNTLVYETHVRGLTARHPDVPPHQRGTYAGLAAPPVIEHLRSLQVTAVELQPVQAFLTERHLAERGLTNYWGYNPIAWFAPHPAYAADRRPGAAVAEFKTVVKALHAAGIEVLLDVVYNHTAEGGADGPTLSLRGLDNAAYYRLADGDPSRYVDYTGTGTTLDLRHPAGLQLVMDSLRYWVTEMHVDGFRFDLAAALARGLHDVDRLSAFFDVIQQDPVIGRVKLIAEPWDLGPGGYQVGNFPPLWSEWNGRYRDTVRDLWRGAAPGLAEFGQRLAGSSDLYADDGRSPYASINYVTAHDGFTLRDLVSYNAKHNDANGEANRDGTDDNRSWNCGAEGPTDDPDINALRARQQRNLLATLLVSHGVPMLCGGDELGRTQAGNNNAYCQDNTLSWHDWEDADHELLAFTRRLTRLRTDHPVLHRRGWFQGRPICGHDVADIVWFDPAGGAMTTAEWEAHDGRALAVFLDGTQLDRCDAAGQPIVDDSLLLVFNADAGDIDFALPDVGGATGWHVLLDTALPDEPPADRAHHPHATITVPARTVVLLRAVNDPTRDRSQPAPRQGEER